jgi:serine protease Do
MKSILLALLVTAGAGGTAVQAGGSDPGFLDHAAISKGFADELGRLYEAGRCTTNKTLNRQLFDRGPRKIALVPESRRDLPWEDVYEKCRTSVVIVGSLYKCTKCEHWHVNEATGFAVDDQGLIATDYHVIEDDKNQAVTIGIRTWDGRVFPADEVVAADRESDVALFRTKATGLAPLPVARDARVGEEVAVLSHPADRFWVFSRGAVAGKAMHKCEHHGDNCRRLLITADFAKGSSGGPVLNRRGAVVGLVQSTTAVNYEPDSQTPRNLQMVWKACVPSVCLFELTAGSRP